MDFRKYDGVVGGVEQVVMQIAGQVTAQGHTIVLVLKESRSDEVKDLFKDQSNIAYVTLRVRSHAISLANAYHDSLTMQNIAQQEKAHVIHFTYNWSFPFRKKVPTLLTIHDVIPFTFREAMGYFRNRFMYKPSLKLACRLNTLISTISEFSKEDIAQKTGVAPEKIKVIPNGFRSPYPQRQELEKELESRFALQDGFVLNVGGIHERKNIVRLIHAFGRFARQTNYAGKLLITGRVSGAPYQEKMKKLCDQAVARTNTHQQVVFTGFVSDEELDQLFRKACFLVYPSLYEGFGIPILEAMNAGVPVITSNATATKEVAQGSALLIDPYSADEMTAAMVKLLADKNLRSQLCQKGKDRANLYSWEKLGRQYLQLYQELARNDVHNNS